MNGIREWQVSKDEIGFFNGLQKITGGKKGNMNGIGEK